MTLNPWGWVQAQIEKTRHPVGYIFEWDDTGLDGAPDLTTPEKVAAYFGYGVWARYGDGRVTVGVVDGKYAAGATGGEESVILKTSEMPKHSHAVTAYINFSWFVKTATGLGENLTTNYQMNIPGVTTTQKAETAKGYLGTNQVGGWDAHNNMQPYVAVYRWRRVA